MKNKNILFFCPREVNVTMGGIERVTDSLARYLIRNGYNVVFMSVEHTSGKEYECVAPQYFTKSDGNERWILEIINKHQIDVVINQMGFFTYCPKESLPQQVKVVTVMHDSYYAMYPHLNLNFFRTWNWKHVMKKSLKQTYDQSDKVVVFVPEFRDEYRFFCPYAKDDKFVIIPNFNSFDNVNAVKKEKKLLWVGRHAQTNKRTNDMIDIWKKLENRFPDWSLDVLGDGPDGDSVRAHLAKKNLSRCYLRGVQNPKPYYESASIVCVTSAYESWCMTLTEGMQHGCVPMAYDSYTAVRHIIHDGKDGLLVTPFDVEEYADKLARLMENEEQRNRLSAAAVESVKQYDAENVMPKWIELLESL